MTKDIEKQLIINTIILPKYEEYLNLIKYKYNLYLDVIKNNKIYCTNSSSKTGLLCFHIGLYEFMEYKNIEKELIKRLQNIIDKYDCFSDLEKVYFNLY